MDTRKINNSIGWMSKINFDEGITATFDWYLNNTSWVESCLEKDNVLKDKEYYERYCISWWTRNKIISINKISK